MDLAETLWISVDTTAGIVAAWDAEIARRVAQLDTGEVTTYPVDYCHEWRL